MYIPAESILSRHVRRHRPFVVRGLRHIERVYRFKEVWSPVLVVPDNSVPYDHVLVGDTPVVLFVILAAGGLFTPSVLVYEPHILLVPTRGIAVVHDAGIESFITLHKGIDLLHIPVVRQR